MPTTLPRPVRHRFPIPVLALVVTALTVVVALAPPTLAGYWPGAAGLAMPSLERRLQSGIVRFWESGSPMLSKDLSEAVAFWQGFHAIKAVSAAALLAAVIALGVAIGGGYARAETRGRRRVLLAAGILTTPLPVIALLVVIANVQGAIAPLSSAISLLPIGDASAATGSTVAEIREHLRLGSQNGPLTVLVHDFAVYHSAAAVLLFVACFALVAVAVALWLTRARTPPTAIRLRRVLTAIPFALLPVAAAFALLAVANLETASDPVEAMLGFFLGGA